jgi:hypothetical protein
MLIYDDTAAPAIEAAAEEARRLGTAGYGTQHLLLGLLCTGDPVTRRVTAEAAQVTVEAVRAALSSGQRSSAASRPDSPRNRPPRPEAEFRRAMRDFTVKWGPLIKARRLPGRPRFSSAELWLVVLEPSARSSELLQSLGAEPQKMRGVVLATMVDDPQALPDWPNDVPVRKRHRVLARLMGWAHVTS